MAAVEKLKATEEGAATIAAADVACGLSLGEYTALCFAGAISFEDGVKITKARGEAMQAASEAASSGMVSVIGLKSDQVEALCKAAAEQSGEPVQIANYLCNGNYACSGSTAAVAKVKGRTDYRAMQLLHAPTACVPHTAHRTAHSAQRTAHSAPAPQVAEIAKPEFKARMAVKLAVAGAFHTDFMKPAVPALEAVLKEVRRPVRRTVWRTVGRTPIGACACACACAPSSSRR